MIQIDELQIRVPGLNGEEGAMLGQEVAERVAAALPGHSHDQHIPELNIRLKGIPTNDKAVVADRIAEQIIRQIKLATFQ